MRAELGVAALPRPDATGVLTTGARRRGESRDRSLSEHAVDTRRSVRGVLDEAEILELARDPRTRGRAAGELERLCRKQRRRVGKGGELRPAIRVVRRLLNEGCRADAERLLSEFKGVRKDAGVVGRILLAVDGGSEHRDAYHRSLKDLAWRSAELKQLLAASLVPPAQINSVLFHATNGARPDLDGRSAFDLDDLARSVSQLATPRYQGRVEDAVTQAFGGPEPVLSLWVGALRESGKADRIAILSTLFDDQLRFNDRGVEVVRAWMGTDGLAGLLRDAPADERGLDELTAGRLADLAGTLAGLGPGRAAQVMSALSAPGELNAAGGRDRHLDQLLTREFDLAPLLKAKPRMKVEEFRKLWRVNPVLALEGLTRLDATERKGLLTGLTLAEATNVIAGLYAGARQSAGRKERDRARALEWFQELSGPLQGLLHPGLEERLGSAALLDLPRGVTQRCMDYRRVAKERGLDQTAGPSTTRQRAQLMVAAFSDHKLRSLRPIVKPALVYGALGLFPALYQTFIAHTHAGLGVEEGQGIGFIAIPLILSKFPALRAGAARVLTLAMGVLWSIANFTGYENVKGIELAAHHPWPWGLIAGGVLVAGAVRGAMWIRPPRPQAAAAAPTPESAEKPLFFQDIFPEPEALDREEAVDVPDVSPADAITAEALSGSVPSAAYDLVELMRREKSTAVGVEVMVGTMEQPERATELGSWLAVLSDDPAGILELIKEAERRRPEPYAGRMAAFEQELAKIGVEPGDGLALSRASETMPVDSGLATKYEDVRKTVLQVNQAADAMRLPDEAFVPSGIYASMRAEVVKRTEPEKGRAKAIDALGSQTAEVLGAWVRGDIAEGKGLTDDLVRAVADHTKPAERATWLSDGYDLMLDARVREEQEFGRLAGEAHKAWANFSPVVAVARRRGQTPRTVEVQREIGHASAARHWVRLHPVSFAKQLANLDTVAEVEDTAEAMAKQGAAGLAQLRRGFELLGGLDQERYYDAIQARMEVLGLGSEFAPKLDRAVRRHVVARLELAGRVGLTDAGNRPDAGLRARRIRDSFARARTYRETATNLGWLALSALPFALLQVPLNDFQLTAVPNSASVFTAEIVGVPVYNWLRKEFGHRLFSEMATTVSYDLTHAGIWAAMGSFTNAVKFKVGDLLRIPHAALMPH